MLSLFDEKQHTHFHALLGTHLNLTISLEKLQRLPAASVLLDSNSTERSVEATSLSRCYLS
jgi:hypothetical protein